MTQTRAVEARPWFSGITETDETQVFLRGRPVSQLLGELSFPEVLLLLWRGETPRREDAQLLEACLVAAVDHGPTTPSAMTARTLSSTRQRPLSCLAGGLQAMTEYHGAVVGACMRVLAEAPARDPEGLRAWAVDKIEKARREGQRVPGVGHRSHTKDVRSERLLELVLERNAASTPVAAVRALAAAVADHAGRPVPVNIDGAVAVALLEIGLDPAYGDFVFAISRSGGLAAHINEERTRQRPMRTIDPTAVTYDGPGSRHHAVAGDGNAPSSDGRS